MANLDINGVVFLPIHYICINGAPNRYYCFEPYGLAPYVTAPAYDEELVKFIGVADVGYKRLGPWTRLIGVEILYLGADEATVEALSESDFASWTQLARFTISLPGAPTLNGCRYLNGSCSLTRQTTIGGFVARIYRVGFIELSATN